MLTLIVAVLHRELNGFYRRLVFTTDLNLQTHVFNLRVVKHFRQVVNRSVGYVIRFELFQPISARLFSKKLSKGFVQLVVIFPAVRPRVKTGIFDQFGTSNRLAQSFPEFLRRRQMDGEGQTVRTRESVSLRLSWTGVRARWPPVGKRFGCRRPEKAKYSAGHRRIDP